MTPRAAVRLLVGGLLLSLALFAVSVQAQYVGGGSIGAAGGGGGGGGAASVLQDALDGIVNILDTGGTARGEIVTRLGGNEVYIQETGGGGVFKADAQTAYIGSTSSISAGSTVLAIADSVNTATGAQTILLRVYGEGVVQPVPASALAISGTPDTTRDPVTAGTSCRFSAASPGQTWTWPENAVTGMFICCTNTGANTVVVNDSAGVFEGTGPTVGQWDTICAEYVTDRWVQRSFMDN